MKCWQRARIHAHGPKAYFCRVLELATTVHTPWHVHSTCKEKRCVCAWGREEHSSQNDLFGARKRHRTIVLRRRRASATAVFGPAHRVPQCCLDAEADAFAGRQVIKKVCPDGPESLTCGGLTRRRREEKTPPSRSRKKRRRGRKIIRETKARKSFMRGVRIQRCRWDIGACTFLRLSLSPRRVPVTPSVFSSLLPPVLRRDR